MTTAGTHRPTKAERKEAAQRLAAEQEARTRRAHVRRIALWVGALVVVGGLVTAGLLSARPTASEATGEAAPAFTLPASDGSTVSLADFRGKPVVLYFSEGAGCDACIQQMAEIEKDQDFAKAGIAVLPIVMNSAAQINPERERFDVKAPFLMDDGTVSKEYGTLGKGMHAGLPGHGFVLVGADGTQLWQGEYPSMWLAPAELYKQVTSRL